MHGKGGNPEHYRAAPIGNVGMNEFNSFFFTYCTSAAHVLTGIIGAIFDICACLPNGRVLEGEGVSWQRHARGCAFCEALDWTP